MSLSLFKIKGFKENQLFDGRLPSKKCSNPECKNPKTFMDGTLDLGEFHKKGNGFQPLCKVCRIKNKKLKNWEIKPGFKKCSSRNKCGNKLKDEEGFIPLTEFNKEKSRPSGFSNYCRFCKSIKSSEEYSKTKDIKSIKHKTHYSENKELYAQRAKNNYQKNKEYILEKAKQYKKEHLEWFKKYHKEYEASYKTKRLEIRKKRLETDLRFKLAYRLRKRLASALKGQLAGKKVSAVKDLGCSVEYLIKYLESKFEPGMTWDNYGKGPDKWNIDHVIALLNKNHDIRKKDTQKKLVHYTNLQPMWHLKNLSKGNR